MTIKIVSEQSQESVPPANWVLIALGYLCAVTVATLSCLIEILLEELPASTSAAFTDRLTGALPALFFIGQFFWSIALVAALPPLVPACVIAWRLRIRSVLYYSAWGAVTGLIFTPLALSLTPHDDVAQSRSFVQDLLFLAPKFMLFGLCGAVTFWFVAGRRLGLSPAGKMGDRP